MASSRASSTVQSSGSQLILAGSAERVGCLQEWAVREQTKGIGGPGLRLRDFDVLENERVFLISKRVLVLLLCASLPSWPER